MYLIDTVENHHRRPLTPSKSRNPAPWLSRYAGEVVPRPAGGRWGDNLHQQTGRRRSQSGALHPKSSVGHASMGQSGWSRKMAAYLCANPSAAAVSPAESAPVFKAPAHQRHRSSCRQLQVVRCSGKLQ